MLEIPSPVLQLTRRTLPPELAIELTPIYSSSRRTQFSIRFFPICEGIRSALFAANITGLSAAIPSSSRRTDPPKSNKSIKAIITAGFSEIGRSSSRNCSWDRVGSSVQPGRNESSTLPEFCKPWQRLQITFFLSKSSRSSPRSSITASISILSFNSLVASKFPLPLVWMRNSISSSGDHSEDSAFFFKFWISSTFDSLTWRSNLFFCKYPGFCSFRDWKSEPHAEHVIALLISVTVFLRRLSSFPQKFDSSWKPNFRKSSFVAPRE